MATPPQLKKYLTENIPKASVDEVRELLLKTGWNEKQVINAIAEYEAEHGMVSSKKEVARDIFFENHMGPEKPGEKKKPAKKKKGNKAVWAAVFFIFLLFGATAGYVYFFIISPTFVKEQVVEKPTLGEVDPFDESAQLDSVIVQDTHVEYLAVAADAFKLHNAPGDPHPPEIEYRVTDTQRTFTIRVVDNVASATEESAINPDIRIFGDKRTLLQLVASPDTPTAMKQFAEEGKIRVELLAAEQTLILKGYKSLYDALS